jgi:hypothetical protein
MRRTRGELRLPCAYDAVAGGGCPDSPRGRGQTRLRRSATDVAKNGFAWRAFLADGNVGISVRPVRAVGGRAGTVVVCTSD